MTQCNSLNVNLSDSQLSKLKSAIKNETEVVLKLSSITNLIGNSDDKINFSHELFITNTKVANLPKVFANNSSTDIKLSQTELSKMIQSGVFLGRLLGPFLEAGLSSMKNVIKPH